VLNNFLHFGDQKVLQAVLGKFEVVRHVLFTRLSMSGPSFTCEVLNFHSFCPLTGNWFPEC